METIFRRSFDRDLRKVRDIANVESADDLSQLRAVRKMKGLPHHYRIRIGDYRIGLVASDTTVEFVRILHRRDIYRSFP